VISLIVAADEENLIGNDNTLPWHLPEDLKRFKRITMGHSVVVGRKTHESIVERLGRPLPGRRTIVVTRATGLSDTETVHYRPTLADALNAAKRVGDDEVFVIGGAEIYHAALPLVQRIYLTRVIGRFDGDTRLRPDWLDGFSLVAEEPATPQYQWLTYERDGHVAVLPG
jgi:dihydrofolate reductase